MSTIIKPELSTKNKYYVDKHRYYELKHFCLQYPKWKKEYNHITFLSSTYLDDCGISRSKKQSDKTSRIAEERIYLFDKIKDIEKTAISADPELAKYILKAVTEELSFNNLKTMMDIPCGRDMYYDRYRKFFWLLDKTKK